MLTGFENLRSNAATGQRVSAPPGTVTTVREPAVVGARAPDGRGGSTADRGLPPPRAERRKDADDRPDEPPAQASMTVSPTITNGEAPPPEPTPTPEAAIGAPPPAEPLPDTAAAVAPEDAQSPEDGPPPSDDARIAGPAEPPERETAEAEAEAPPPAPRAVTLIEPDSSEMLAAHRAYAASLELAGTRTATIPAGAVLDGTV